MKRNKKIGLIVIFALIAVIAYAGVKLTQPSYAFTMDVNPSIEIVSNRLDRVVEVNPLNDDAQEMLKDFELKDKDLKNTIVDLADLMVLTGYISGGEDNLVMITVDDDNANNEILDELNRAIAAYLENKQIEATIVNQSISQQASSGQTGKEMIIQRISDLDDDLNYDDIANMTLVELIRFVESKNIAPEELFTELITTVNSNTNNNGRNNKSNTQTSSKTESKPAPEPAQQPSKPTLIGDARAKEIALGKTGGGTVVEFELDWDDGRPEYEIEIKKDGYEYEVEIDGYTGNILEFEIDD